MHVLGPHAELAGCAVGENALQRCRVGDGRREEVVAQLEQGALADGTACQLGVRPEDVHLASEPGIPATVYVTEPLGGETVVDLDVGGRLVKALTDPVLKLVEGETVQLVLDGSRLHLFDESGDSLLAAAGDPLFAVSVS